MKAYYNDNDRPIGAWLTQLAGAGEISAGTIDTRSIVDVQPADLRGFERVHLFAGIAGWEEALRLARWPAGRPVWTGSPPCQPFSSAGKGLGEADPRHLWPQMRRLVAELRPPTIFGEQVIGKSNIGLDWLDRVRLDLEALGYAVGAADLCAAGVGAPHERQRIFWLANACGGRREQGAKQIRGGGAI